MRCLGLDDSTGMDIRWTGSVSSKTEGVLVRKQRGGDYKKHEVCGQNPSLDLSSVLVYHALQP